jgi:hypothetical protein
VGDFRDKGRIELQLPLTPKLGRHDSQHFEGLTHLMDARMVGTAQSRKAEKPNPGLNTQKAFSASSGGLGNGSKLLGIGINGHCAIRKNETSLLTPLGIGQFHDEATREKAMGMGESDAGPGCHGNGGRNGGGSGYSRSGDSLTHGQSSPPHRLSHKPSGEFQGSLVRFPSVFGGPAFCIKLDEGFGLGMSGWIGLFEAVKGDPKFEGSLFDIGGTSHKKGNSNTQIPGLSRGFKYPAISRLR